MVTLAKARILGLCQQCRCKPPEFGKSCCKSCRIKTREAYKQRSKNLGWMKKKPKYANDWDKNNPELKKQYSSKCRSNLKNQVFDHYGYICKCCGESQFEFLTIDHINGGGNEHKRKIGKGTSDLHRWLIKNNFPDEFQILCFNCNCSKGIYGTCPHQDNK